MASASLMKLQGVGLCHNHPQEPGLRIPGSGDPAGDEHCMILARNLLYTGVTRGKRLVVLVGQRKALAIAVRNQGSRRRWAKPQPSILPAARAAIR